MMDLEDWRKPDQLCSTDTCLIGAGATFAENYFHCNFPDFIREQQLHINNLELLTIVVAVKVWGHLLTGKKLVIKRDNKSSILVLNSGSSCDSFSQSCLREICFFSAIHHFEIPAVFIAGSENRIPDFLSRWNLNQKYRELFYTAVGNKSMQQVPVPDNLFYFTHDWRIIQVVT